MKSYISKAKKTSLVVLALLLVLAAFGCKGQTEQEADKPLPSPSGLSTQQHPNIVLIVIDALRPDKLGCYGFEGGISPEIDTMAREGVLFENVFSQCSWTRPSIGSMITSLHPRSTGIFKEKFDMLHNKYLTLAEVLKSKGYLTYGITANPNINKLFNFHQGFDVYQDSNVVWNWMTPRKGQEQSDGNSHLPQCRDIFNEVLAKAAAFKQHAPDQPVYVQINIMEVHSPYLIRDEYKDAYKDYPVREINFKYPRQKLESLVRGTLAAVKQTSSDFSAMVQQLRTIPGWSNTLFVITSDHGQGLDDHPDVDRSTAHGNLLYESHLRVPLIFYHPEPQKRKYTPHRVAQPGRLLDLMPTILDYAGIPLPKDHKIDGVSLVNRVTGSGEPPQLPEFFTAETAWRNVNKLAVYSGEWKYFVNKDKWPGVNHRELQPMGITENGKLTDKINGHPEIAKKMIAWLARWASTVKPATRHYPKGKLSPKELEQLKQLGYLQ